MQNLESINPVLTPKDFVTDQEVRWCPGCGDYAILSAVRKVFPKLGIPREDFVIISGIGCSSRFPYYMNVYGMHGIHGRAAAIASGLKATRPELSVWVVTGDGDCLSIGGNHIIHLLRRNFDINVILFNNEIYGLTKGQYSPTSKLKQITKSSPYGVIDQPFNPLSLALGAGATFIARTMDRDPKHMEGVLTESYEHKGASFIEIYQNCNIFNDGAFEIFTDKKTKPEKTVFLENSQPLVFGTARDKGIKLDGLIPTIVNLDACNSVNDLWIHDEKDLRKAQLLVSMFNDVKEENHLPRPFGIFYNIDKPRYEVMMEHQIQEAKTKTPPDLDKLLMGGEAEVWEIKREEPVLV